MLNLGSVFKHCHCHLVGTTILCYNVRIIYTQCLNLKFLQIHLFHLQLDTFWCLPDNHEICVKYDHSFKNVTVSNLIKDLNSYGVCCGITDKTLGYSFTEHSVPKQFSLTDAICKKIPLHQSKFYRNQHCRILIPTESNKCHHCRKSDTSEKVILSEN